MNGEKIKAYLDLVRFPNLFTAIADPLAGYLLAVGVYVRLMEAVLLIIASSAIYAGGCVLNDFCDRESDAYERPLRPIPSGRVVPEEARALAAMMFALGLFAAFLLGFMPFVAALALTASALSYDIMTKHRPVAGPFNMGLCRSLNLLLGMAVVYPELDVSSSFPLISLVYAFTLTRLSRFETVGQPSAGDILVLSGWVFVIMAMVFFWNAGLILPDSLPFLAAFTLYTGYWLIRTLYYLSPQYPGLAVKALILGMPLINAAYVSGIQGWEFGAGVALCFVPAAVFSRYFQVT